MGYRYLLLFTKHLSDLWLTVPCVLVVGLLLQGVSLPSLCWRPERQPRPPEVSQMYLLTRTAVQIRPDFRILQSVFPIRIYWTRIRIQPKISILIWIQETFESRSKLFLNTTWNWNKRKLFTCLAPLTRSFSFLWKISLNQPLNLHFWDNSKSLSPTTPSWCAQRVSCKSKSLFYMKLLDFPIKKKCLN